MRRVIVLALLVFMSLGNVAGAATSQQLDAFKALPKSKQIELAKSMGVDISSLGSAKPSTSENEIDFQQQIDQRELQNVADYLPEDELKPLESELELFGSNIFFNNNSVLSQNISSVPGDYNLVVGDIISVTFYGKETLSVETQVDTNGALILPGLSPVYALGMPFSDLVKVIQEKTKAEKIGVEALVSVAKIQPISVFIGGEVLAPGMYTLPAFSSVVNAIGIAGGISKFASLRNISVKSKKNNTSIDLYDLLLKGDAAFDVPLKNGDVIFIPTSQKLISIKGEVKKAGIYELKPSEGFEELLMFAGGFSPSAHKNNITINSHARSGGKYLRTISYSENYDVLLKDGDLVNVKRVSPEIQNEINIIGAITRPGSYEWNEKVSLKSIFNSNHDFFLPITDLNYALILRDLDEQKEVIQFAPSEINSLDIKLNKKDVVLFFSKFELEDDELAVIQNIAIDREQYELNSKLHIWSKYEEQRFHQFTSQRKEEERLEGVNSLRVSWKKPIYLSEIFESEKRPKLAFYSRSRLLPPILKALTLEYQNSNRSRIVQVSGNVKYPGLYPLAKNATARDLVTAAGGVLPGTNIEKAELTSLEISSNGTDRVTKSFNLGDALSGGAENLYLKGNDYINILKLPEWQENRTVLLKGEVKYPGRYSISRHESLSDVIVRAGGFTEFADIDAAIFTRESLKQLELQQIKTLSQEMKKEFITNNLNSNNSIVGGASNSEIERLIEQLNEVKPVGRLVINTNDVVSNKVEIFLEDNDALYVPSKRQSLNVIGEVYVPTSHLFDESLTLEDYISKSGGLKDKALEESIYIIKSNGQVVLPSRSSWFAVHDGKTSLNAGDTIVVPLNSQYKDNMTLWTQATQIIYQLGVAVAAVSAL